MPLYEYQCETCGHRFEVIQKFSDAPLETCPKCGGVVRKLLSSPAFHFKGSGWYITDYARKGQTGNESGSSSQGSSGDSSAGSGESKSDAAGTTTDTKAETKSVATPDSKSDSKAESKPSTSD